MKRSHLTALALSIGIASASTLSHSASGLGGVGIVTRCAPATLALCQTKSYVDSCAVNSNACSILEGNAVSTWSDPNAKHGVPLWEPTAEKIPANLTSGDTHPYLTQQANVPLNGGATYAGWRERQLELVRTSPYGIINVPAYTANPKFEQNGEQILSCYEYTYEKFYDISRFEDAMAACQNDLECKFNIIFYQYSTATGVGAMPGLNHPYKDRHGQVFGQPGEGPVDLDWANANQSGSWYSWGKNPFYVTDLPHFVADPHSLIIHGGYIAPDALLSQYFPDMVNAIETTPQPYLYGQGPYQGDIAGSAPGKPYRDLWHYNYAMHQRVLAEGVPAAQAKEYRRRRLDYFYWAGIYARDSQTTNGMDDRAMARHTPGDDVFDPMGNFFALSPQVGGSVMHPATIGSFNAGGMMAGVSLDVGSVGAPPVFGLPSAKGPQGNGKYSAKQGLPGAVALSNNGGGSGQNTTVPGIDTTAPWYTPTFTPPVQPLDSDDPTEMAHVQTVTVPDGHGGYRSKHVVTCNREYIPPPQYEEYTPGKGDPEGARCQMLKRLVDEWEHLATGDSCLDGSKYGCDWTLDEFISQIESTFRNRFANAQEAAYGYCQKYSLKGNLFSQISPPDNPSKAGTIPYWRFADIPIFENLLAEEKAMIDAATNGIPTIDDPSHAGHQRFGEHDGDRRQWGDTSSFSAGFVYDFGWDVNPKQKTTNNVTQICDLDGGAHAMFKVAATTPFDKYIPSGLANIWRELIDAGSYLDVNRTVTVDPNDTNPLVVPAVGGPDQSHLLVSDFNGITNFDTHLIIAGAQVFDPIVFQNQPVNYLYSPVQKGEENTWPILDLPFQAGPVTITITLGMGAQYGFRLEASTYGVPGCTAQNATPKYGAKLSFEPYADAYAYLGVDAGILGCSVGLTGKLTIISIKLPMAAQAGITTTTDPVSQGQVPGVEFDVSSKIVIGTLGGELDAVVKIFFVPVFEAKVFEWKGKEWAYDLFKPIKVTLPLKDELFL